MPRLTPPTREQIEDAAAQLEKFAAKIRAADPNKIYILDVNRMVDYYNDPFAADPEIAADHVTARVEWIKEPDRG